MKDVWALFLESLKDVNGKGSGKKFAGYYGLLLTSKLVILRVLFCCGCFEDMPEFMAVPESLIITIFTASLALFGATMWQKPKG